MSVKLIWLLPWHWQLTLPCVLSGCTCHDSPDPMVRCACGSDTTCTDSTSEHYACSWNAAECAAQSSNRQERKATSGCLVKSTLTSEETNRWEYVPQISSKKPQKLWCLSDTFLIWRNDNIKGNWTTLVLSDWIHGSAWQWVLRRHWSGWRHSFFGVLLKWEIPKNTFQIKMKATIPKVTVSFPASCLLARRMWSHTGKNCCNERAPFRVTPKKDSLCKLCTLMLYENIFWYSCTKPLVGQRIFHLCFCFFGGVWLISGMKCDVLLCCKPEECCLCVVPILMMRHCNLCSLCLYILL